MSGNRVDELEQEVAELKATVQGLTEELVEAHERLRLVEEKVGDEPIDSRVGRSDESVTPDTDGEAETDEAGTELLDASENDPGTDESLEADQEEVEQAAAEADKSEGGQEADEKEDGTDDIIVA